MITGFNTDVQHEGRVYHVQTEDRGSREDPVLESLVYIGGTIIAKKRTPYGEQLRQGATEEAIASLLKKQHQVIIAAIKAGRIEDLIKHSAKERSGENGSAKRPEPSQKLEAPRRPEVLNPILPATPQNAVVAKPPPGANLKGTVAPGSTPPPAQPPAVRRAEPPKPNGQQPSNAQSNGAQASNLQTSNAPPNEARAGGPQASKPRTSGSLTAKPAAPAMPASTGKTGGLNLDQVISDYLKRSSEQGRLELKVLTPSVFTAGKSVGLRVQVSFNGKSDPEAVVTIKIIGTAFKPQVFIGRVGPDGIANFSLALPAFTAGTAAIVIEAQSRNGRGELKHLIRRA